MPIRRCLTVETAAPPAAERIALALEEAEEAPEAIGVFEKGDGREVWAHYAVEPNLRTLEALIKTAAAGEAFSSLRLEPLADADWVAQAERLRGPVRAGRFLVHGAHDRAKVPQGRFTLEIDAGLAFGTAHHGSTRGCLLALDRLLKRRRPGHVIDIGTGTGILAIAAAKALNAPVFASDNDPIAIVVALKNAKKNGVAGRLRLEEAEGLAHPALRQVPVDLLFANLLLRPLLDLAPGFARTLRPGGTCVLSGILETQAPQVEAQFRAFGFTLDSRILLDGWATLLLKRGSARKGATRIDWD